jgi:hypothetical protein
MIVLPRRQRRVRIPKLPQKRKKDRHDFAVDKPAILLANNPV